MGKIVVTTPTGNIGHVVTQELIKARADVAVIVRDPAKLPPDVRNEATVHQGDMYDTAFVQAATANADALFWLTPPDFHAPEWKALYDKSARVAAAAVSANRIPHVVHVSSGGADRAEGWGPVSFIQTVENALAATGANVLHLRAGYFYENFLGYVGPIRDQGAMYLPIPADVSYPLIATRDIGQVAARKLLSRDWTGNTVLGLHGPASQPTFGQAAQIIGDAVGKPVQYIQVPMDAVRDQFTQMGMSSSVVKGYTELLGALARGEQPLEPRTPETTTPTTLQEWAAEVMRPMVQNQLTNDH